MPDDKNDPLRSTADTAEYLGVTVGTLQRWVAEGVVTPALRLPGGEYRWDTADLRQQLRPDRPVTPRNQQQRQTGRSVPKETAAHKPAIVAAIVTNGQHVLIGKRNDGKPPWTFIAGENEPGETFTDTIVREVKEETGLEIDPGQIIGERHHPATGRHMVYIAGAPARPGEADVFVGDTDELAEVRWATAAEADELLPGMFEPVHEHLAATIGQ